MNYKINELSKEERSVILKVIRLFATESQPGIEITRKTGLEMSEEAIALCLDNGWLEWINKGNGVIEMRLTDLGWIKLEETSEDI